MQPFPDFYFRSTQLCAKLEQDEHFQKLALDLIGGGRRFSDQDMLH